MWGDDRQAILLARRLIREGVTMKKLLIAGGATAGAVLLARRCARSCGGVDFERLIERMPDDAPPKWMFRNISTIRKNTERILEMLEAERDSNEARQVESVV